MKKIEVEEVEDGYIVTFTGTVKHDGRRVRSKIQEYEMLELIGEQICDHKIKVVRK